jgi:hypothetical protein
MFKAWKSDPVQVRVSKTQWDFSMIYLCLNIVYLTRERFFGGAEFKTLEA